MGDFLTADFFLQGDAFNPPKRDAEIRTAIRQQMILSSEYLVGVLGPATPAGATGVFRRAWYYVYDGIEQTATITPSVEYAAPVELGRKAAGVPSAPLELWVRRKLGVTQEKSVTKNGVTVLGFKAIAYLIGRKKKAKATPGQLFATKAFNTAVPAVNAAMLGPLGSLIVQRLDT